MKTEQTKTLQIKKVIDSSSGWWLLTAGGAVLLLLEGFMTIFLVDAYDGMEILGFTIEAAQMVRSATMGVALALFIFLASWYMKADEEKKVLYGIVVALSGFSFLLLGLFSSLIPLIGSVVGVIKSRSI